MNGMKRVNEHGCARERQAASDCATAETFDQGGFRASLEPRFREPGRKLGDLGLCHSADHRSSGTEGQRGRPCAWSGYTTYESGDRLVLPCRNRYLICQPPAPSAGSARLRVGLDMA